MAELRIPTDRIPADILQRLQAIGHSIIFPGAASTATTTTTTAATLSATKSAIATSQTLASVGASVDSRTPVTNAAAAHEARTQMKESYADRGLSLSATSPSLEPTFLSTSSQMTRTSSTPLSSLSSFPSTSSSPPLLGPFCSPPNRPTENFASFTSFVERAQSSSHSHHRSISSTSDETDGQASVTDPASIVHVLDLNQHRKRGGHPVDESDIVRIFPLEDGPGAQEEPDNMNNAIERPSEIVRVFPELSHTERSVEQESPRANRVFSTPTKRQKINRHNPSTVSTDINSSNTNLHHQQQQQQQQQCIQPPPPASCLSEDSIVPHMLSQPPVFTLKDGEIEEFPDDELQNHSEVLNVNNSPFKGKVSTSLANATNQMRTPSSSTSVQKRNQSFSSPSRSRLTPPVPAISRRSPGVLVTPPMTPDDIGEDEVFTYDNTKDDSLSLSGRRAFATYRQKIECTPRRGSPTPSQTPSSNQRRHSDLAVEHRQVKHAQFHPDQAHSASNPASAPPKCSPFSPAQRLSELSFGDRQHTRKRLSFEDCVEKSADRVIDIDSCSSATQQWYSPSQDASGKLSPNYHSDPSLTQYQHHYPSHSNIGRENTPLHRTGQSQDPEVSHQYTLHKNLHSCRPRPSKSVSPSIFSFDQTDINKNKNGMDKAQSGSTITVSSPYKFASSARAVTHNADIAKSQVSHQYYDASFHNSTLLHSSAKCHSQAPPSSPVHPIPVQNLDPSHCRTLAYVQSHKPEVFPRGRLHSEGDSTPDVAGFSQARQRLQTFSHGKRRRLAMQESEDNGDPISAHTTSVSQSPAFSHQATENNPIPASVYRTFTPHQLQPRHQQLQQSQQEQQQNYQQQQQSQPPPAAHIAECGPCACATIERDFLQVAEYAYKRIRCLDNSPGDFDRFRREMAQTNDMLKEWLIIMGNIRNICGHSPSTSVQTSANTISSVPSASSSSQASSNISLSMPVSISGSSSLTPSSEGRTSSSSPTISSAYCLNIPVSQPVPCVASAPSYPNSHPFQVSIPSSSTMVQNSMQFSSMSVESNEHFH